MMTEYNSSKPKGIFPGQVPPPPFRPELLPGPVKITAYTGDSLNDLSIHKFSLYGVECIVNHMAPVPYSENSRYDWLTERQELAVLLGAFGLSADQGADFLKCGTATVNTNRRNGLKRLGARGWSAMYVGTRKLVETGVISFSDAVTVPFAEEPRIPLYLNGLSEGKTLEVLHLDVMGETGDHFTPWDVKSDIKRFRQEHGIPGMSLAVLAGIGAGLVRVPDIIVQP